MKVLEGGLAKKKTARKKLPSCKAVRKKASPKKKAAAKKKRNRRHGTASKALEISSRRELVLQLHSNGHSGREIGKILKCSHTTVDQDIAALVTLAQERMVPVAERIIGEQLNRLETLIPQATRAVVTEKDYKDAGAFLIKAMAHQAKLLGIEKLSGGEVPAGGPTDEETERQRLAKIGKSLSADINKMMEQVYQAARPVGA